jgi:hypothetical protein
LTEAPGAAGGRGGFRDTVLLAALTAAAVTAAYQVARPVVVSFDAAWPTPVSTRGVFPVENGFRWTSGPSAMRVAGPGPRRAVTVQATVSAWRPRGAPPTQARLSTGGASALAVVGPAPAELSVTTETGASAWGEVEVRFESDTFAPGSGDPRRLGVRVHRLRVAPVSGPLAPGWPPPLPVAWAVAAVLLAWQAMARTVAESRHARRAGIAAALAIAAGLALARAWTVWLLPVMAAAGAVWVVLAALRPRPLVTAARTLGEAAVHFGQAVRALDARRLAALAVLAAAAVTAAYRLQPVVVIPVGDGRETAFEHGLGSFDSVDGVRLRHLVGRATLDLRDLGAGDWRVSVTAAAPGEPRALALASAGGRTLEAPLGPAWSRHTLAVHAPAGWRSGVVLELPGSRRDDIWVREVHVDRGAAWPSLRIVTLACVTGVLLAVALLAAGVESRPAWIGAPRSSCWRRRRWRSIPWPRSRTCPPSP